MNSNILPWWVSILLSTILLLNPEPAQARSVYDPFIQDFQVGVHSDPQKIDLALGFPAGLLTPAELDTVWCRGASAVLGQAPDLKSPHLTLRLLAAMENPEAAESWVRWHLLRIKQLEASADTLVTAGRYLLSERLTMGFFRALEIGDLPRAENLALRLSREGMPMGLPARERFVWDLRQRLLATMQKKSRPAQDAFWASLLDLGIFDTGNAWALWTAHRKDLKLQALPGSLVSQKQAQQLAVLRKSWLSAADIGASAFSGDVKSGLGAKLLRKEQLNLHLKKHPVPPTDSTLQGWWVSGQRSARRGETGFYESLARDKRLGGGWRMDLWRRASEVHLLNGRWQPGLADLREALTLSGQNAGSRGQRRRLRQWAEQALVLAIAKGKMAEAAAINEQALTLLKGEQKEVYQEETLHWATDLSLPPAPADNDQSLKNLAGQLVESGQARAIEPVSGDRQDSFRKASQTPLWKLWAKWGLALVPDRPGSARVSRYRAALQQCLGPDATDEQVVLAVGPLLNGLLPQEEILRWTLDKDIHHWSGGLSLTATSPMSGLGRKQRDNKLALHAMLGVALLADDMRGTVGLATPLPQTGLTRREELCFLYPLPQRGSIHRSLVEADNDPALVLAVARSESLFEPSIRSRAGALGFMQIMPFHFPDKGAGRGALNWSSAAVSIRKGDGLLKENRRRYEGNPYLSLAAYNAGPGAVARWQKQLGASTRDDIFLAWIGYPETRHYVQKVLIDREIYDWIIRESRQEP